MDSNCSQCDDYLQMADWVDRMVCPICFEQSVRKRNAATDLLKQIQVSTKDEALKKRINAVLEMRDW